MSRKVWFALPAEYSPDGSLPRDSPVFQYKEFSTLLESSSLTEVSSDLSQYSFKSDEQSRSLSQFSISKHSMEGNTTGETCSTNESQDVSSSQQESTMSDGPYCYVDNNSTSSVHDEVVNSAIMEVSGELMLGKLSPHKQPSGGSESSDIDISDDDSRRHVMGGSIAKYPEDSTGLSDNDWNPYATESDTNQTPRSPRSNASDDQSRVGFVSKAMINITPPDRFRDPTTTVSMTTGEITRLSGTDRVTQPESRNPPRNDAKSDRLDILRYMIDNENPDQAPADNKASTEPRFESRFMEDYKSTARQSIPEDDLRQSADTLVSQRTETPDTVKSLPTEDNRTARLSTGSGASDLDQRRQSAESTRSFQSEGSGQSSGRLSVESNQSVGDYRRERGPSATSEGSLSDRQSIESGQSGHSSRSEFDKTGESNASGRQSMESQQSQKSNARSAGSGSDRSERLDRLGNAGDNIKELIQFESSQRAAGGSQEKDADTEMQGRDVLNRYRSDVLGDSVSRTRLTAKLEPYTAPLRSSRSPEPSTRLIGSSGYISISERNRLLNDSPELNHYPAESAGSRADTVDFGSLPRRSVEERDNLDFRQGYMQENENQRPTNSGGSGGIPKFPSYADRSPSDNTMRRVSNLFEETKKQVRAAVAIPRPDPSGSEERFPLRERMDVSQHEDSFRNHSNEESNRRRENSDKYGNSRSMETARSITSEEVARVLGRYSEHEKENQQPSSYTYKPLADVDGDVKVSAFDKVDKDSDGGSDSVKVSDLSDDEIAKRVRAILSDTDHIGVKGGNGKSRPATDYVPHTINYNRLQQDLQEIQDSLHDVAPSQANDSLYIQSKRMQDAVDATADEPEDRFKSLENTGTTTRESGASENGRKLAWDYGADLKYDEELNGQFMGTRSSGDTLTSTLKGAGDADTMTSTPYSISPAVSHNFTKVGTKSSTGTSNDISRAERIVEQVLNRQAEGDLQENVEDIIARYRNERRDLFDRLQPTSQSSMEAPPPNLSTNQNSFKQIHAPVPAPRIQSESSSQIRSSTPQNGINQSGLAERVYKILTSDKEVYHEPDSETEKGMAKTVFKILSEDRPQQQVNGILSEAMAEEHEMLKKLISRPKDISQSDSSLDDSGLNGTSDSFGLEDRDVRRHLEWSQMSSPTKGEKSELDFHALREVTKAPYSAMSNVNNLLSSQLKKTSERNFDKSVELRTPYRQAINCYPVYGVDREPGQEDVREAWMPRVQERQTRPTGASRSAALSNDRFYLTDKDSAAPSARARPDTQGDPQTHHRTYSDPHDVSPTRRTAPARDSGNHARSKSSEASSVSDLSQYSIRPSSPTDRRAASSPRSMTTIGTGPLVMGTPQQHRPPQVPPVKKLVTISSQHAEWSCEVYSSVSIGDSSDIRNHSNSSDDNLWCNHGYQMYPRDPEDDLCNSRKRSLSASPNRQSNPKLKVPNDSSWTKGQEMTKISQNDVKRNKKIAEKPVKGQKVNFKGQDSLSRSFPNYYEGRGFVQQVPRVKDDVFELLTRSRAQEKKLADLQRKVQDQQIMYSKSDKAQGHSKGHSDDPVLGSRVSPVGSHGYRARTSTPNKSRRSQNNNVKFRYSGRESSPTESDSSGSKRASKLRPYRPAGSRDVYYTESGDDTNESGTTVESTHLGSDDTVPPYIPSQYLGSRRDEPSKHPTGIYGNNKDDLSTIDEQSAKDDKEKALSTSTGSSGRDRASNKEDVLTVGADSGVGSSAAWTRDTHDLRPSHTERSRSPYSQRDPEVNMGQSGQNAKLEIPGFKTRAEFQRDFERRERELKEVLSSHRERISQAGRQSPSDQLGASVRSDPGGQDDPGARWEYRDSEEASNFLRMEPEPAYPQERLRYSRSRSEADLIAMSPTDSQKYSSPMQPGTRFLELSTQPSPIFSHHDSITFQPRGTQPARDSNLLRTQQVPAELPVVPTDRERRPVPQELPIERQSRPQSRELPVVDDRRRSPVRGPDCGQEVVRPLEPGVSPRSPGHSRSAEVIGQVDLGADPRRMDTDWKTSENRLIRQRTKSPLQVRQKEMENELLKLNQDLANQVTELAEAVQAEAEGVAKSGGEEFEDNFPPSKKAQVLREVLEQEYMDTLPPNLNDMWARFKERKDQSLTESSLNSTRLDALSGLLQNPTQHTVTSFSQEKNEEIAKRKQEEKEQAEKLREERHKSAEKERKVSEMKAAQQRSQKRQELMTKHGLSESESNGSYTELIMERERQDRQKKETRKKRRSPEKARTESKGRKEQGHPSKNDKGSLTDIKNRNSVKAQLSDSIDTLFSIPEDASFEQSPTKYEKSRQRRHRHVIDPLMMKLRDKIKLQRDKIDKERRKELQRVEKLKKLEMLLTAKKKGRLSDRTIDVELQDVSTTTSIQTMSETSQLSSDLQMTVSSALDSDTLSEQSTLPDSTVNSIRLQVKKYPNEYMSESTESSDFSNIRVERVQEKKSGKNKNPSADQAGKKEKRYKLDEYGNRIKKQKNKSKEVFGVEMSDAAFARQIRKYEQFMTPEKKTKPSKYAKTPDYKDTRGSVQDVGTMFPSPITVSPPRHRQMRKVLMKSEAIQTSPSIRSSSPTHAYDEVPVAPVPLMSRHSGQSGRTSRRRPSPSPPRSPAKSSQTRIPSKSPAKSRSRSPSAGRGKRSGLPSMPRKVVESAMWKPESESPPPDNSMFTPENMDENCQPPKLGITEAQTWFVPMKPSQPWRQPLKERQAFSVSQEPWQPSSVTMATWKNIVHGDVVKDKGDPNDVSRDTKFDLDPDGQPIREEDLDDSDVSEDEKSKPLSKMSLQEAFQLRKQSVISHSRQRQKRLNLAAEDRKMEAFLKLERDKLFNEERRKEANPEAHPYSEHLHKPARRIINKEEMKEMARKKYEKLPEVLEKEKNQRRVEDYSLYRLKARLYNRKIQRKVLTKAEKWGR